MGIIDYLKNKDFKKVSESEITAEDIRDFSEYYQEFLDLKQQYAKAITGRKEIANEIREKIIFIRDFLDILNQRMKSLDMKLQFSEECINNNEYEKVLNVILRLANKGMLNFTLKRFTISGKASFETQHGDREYGTTSGNIWVIGESNVLSKIAVEETYFRSDFRIVAEQMLKFGHSLVIFTDYLYEENVKPSCVGKKVNQKDIKVSGSNGNISCYLCEDNLKDAVNSFQNFIDQNGADIYGMDEDSLFNAIISYNKGKVLEKI